MPNYDYACTECSHTFEHFQTMTSDLLTECPECKGKLRRLIGSGGALIFKGTGFYCTDYKKPGASTTTKGDGSSSPSKSGDTSDGSSDSSSGGSSDSSSGSSSDSSNESAA